MTRRKSATLSNRYNLNRTNGTGPTAAPGPRGEEMANDYRLNSHLLCRVAARSMVPRDDSAGAQPRRRNRTKLGTGHPIENRAPRGGLSLRFHSENDASLEQEFAAAAAGVAAEYLRRLSGLHGLHRHQRADAARAIKEWHTAALSALRRERQAKRAAARQRRIMRNRPFRPPPRRRPHRSYPQRRPS